MDAETFRARYRELIRRYHPDRAPDDDVRERYEAIAKRLNERWNEVKRSRSDPSGSRVAGGPAPTAGRGTSRQPLRIAGNGESDYLLYRAAIDCFQGIHPPYWSRKGSVVSVFEVFASDRYEEQLQVMETLLQRMDDASALFRAMVAKYPNSPYSGDSRDKIAELKRRYDRLQAVVEELMNRMEAGNVARGHGDV